MISLFNCLCWSLHFEGCLSTVNSFLSLALEHAPVSQSCTTQRNLETITLILCSVLWNLIIDTCDLYKWTWNPWCPYILALKTCGALTSCLFFCCLFTYRFLWACYMHVIGGLEQIECSKKLSGKSWSVNATIR